MKPTFPFLLLCLLFLLQACQTEISQWRGEHRDGIYPETDLLESWPEEGPELLWTAEGLGLGYAAPLVSGTAIFINGESGGDAFVVAMDLEGREVWKRPNGKEFLGEGFSATYPGARSTPTLVGKHLYATSGTGRLTCLKASDGMELWSHDLIRDFDGHLGYFGYSECVAVDRDKVYCQPAGQENNMLALDRFTGELIWSSALLGDTTGYGSPIFVELPGRKVLVTVSKHFMMVVDCADGRLLSSWNLPTVEYEGDHCNTPVYQDGYLYFVGGDPHGLGAVKLELSSDGSSLREVWRNMAVKNNFGGFILKDERLYTTVRGNKLLALNTGTGEVVDSLKVGNGSMVYADGKFFVNGWNGGLSMVGGEPGALEVRGQAKVGMGTGQHFAHPVLANGRMYLRRGDALMAYVLR